MRMRNTVSTKRSRKFFKTFLEIKIIDCINDSISVALPFNKEPEPKVSSQIGRRALIFGQKTKIITFYPKNSFKGTFHQILI